MPIKISRDIALIKYRVLPLHAFDQKNDEDFYFLPDYFSFHWIALEKTTNKRLTKEFHKLIKLLEIKELIILGQINKRWISKLTGKRKDFKSIIKALEYFNKNKINKKFNGAVKISTEEINTFIPRFYTITECDGGFFDFYITNEMQNVLFHIHYSGRIKILTLDKEMKEKIKITLSKTKFIDSLREGTDSIK
ncbi:hypothetical protein [Chryseobacterium sp. MP_3.2]|uniref:hypothetical protein n=1 Tax=Chryseobacterium sp. MP_3.2 TaxID=3071712 RepID=UPI002DFB9A73|nr:hypothetical protein [Chryseobacterium sp. MP_3.2]